MNIKHTRTMALRAVGFAMALAFAGVTPAPASAQSPAGQDTRIEVNAGSGWGQLWDDETNLGTGAPVAGGISVTIGERFRLGADVDWLSHTRDAGYLKTDGDLFGAFGRASYLFGRPGARVRGYAGAGLGMLRSTGVLTFDRADTPWSLARGAYDLHGGARLALAPRLALRPEYRWRATFAGGSRSGIEAPLVGMQALVLLDISLR